MAKVNLLPPELGGTKRITSLTFNIQRLHIFFLCLSLIFFLAGAYLRLETIYRKKRLLRVSQEYKDAQELKKKIEALKQEQSKLNEEADALGAYLKRDILWSKKLEQLRLLLPKEVWLSRLAFEEKAARDSYVNSLYLKGSLIPKSQDSPIGTLSAFVNNLKADKAFFEDFDNIILGDFRSENYKNIETMAFSIEMPLKPR